MKKALRETQTLRTGYSKAGPKIFSPLQTPFLGAQDGQNFISWRWSLPSPTDPVWWRSMHMISSYRGNRPTHTHKQRNPQTGPITIHCTAKLSAQCNYSIISPDICYQNMWILVTDPQTHKHTHKQTNPLTGPITILSTAKLSTQCNYITTLYAHNELKHWGHWH